MFITFTSKLFNIGIYSLKKGGELKELWFNHLSQGERICFATKQRISLTKADFVIPRKIK